MPSRAQCLVARLRPTLQNSNGMHGGDENPSPLHRSSASGTGAVAITGPVSNSQISTTVYSSPSPSQRIAHLLECLQHEVDNNDQAKDILADLRRITAPQVANPKTLEEKLIDGDRADQTDFALESKQEFVMKLARFDLYPSAQAIHYFVLAKIHTIFTSQIRPLIRRGAVRDEIEQAIQYRIIEPTLTDLQTNPFGYTHLEVTGMIYFLTGTCKICWD